MYGTFTTAEPPGAASDELVEKHKQNPDVTLKVGISCKVDSRRLQTPATHMCMSSFSGTSEGHHGCDGCDGHSILIVRSSPVFRPLVRTSRLLVFADLAICIIGHGVTD